MELFWKIVDVVLRIIGFLSIPLLLWGVWRIFKSLRKYHPIKPWGLVIQMLIPVGTLVVYGLFLGLEPSQWASGLLFTGGLVLGVASSRTTGMDVRDGQVFGARNAWYLVAWAATFTLTQLLALFARTEVAAYGFSTLYFSVGLALAVNGSLLYRRWAMLSGQMPTAAVPAMAVVGSAAPTGAAAAPADGLGCPSCGRGNPPEARFCIRCGTPL